MGFHADIASFEPRSLDILDSRRELWLWAEPVIIDRAVAFYGGLVDEAGVVAMARRHCRLWRHMLHEQQDAIGALRTEMYGIAAGLDVPRSAVDEADDAILEEVVDIVTGRYRSSRRTIKTVSMVLMSAMASLGAARAA